MKINQVFAICGIATALFLSAGSVSAQDNGGGGGGGGGFGGGGFDPAAMQQRMMDNVREQLNFTNDTDWSAVQPLVQKVMDAQRDFRGFGAGGARLLFGRNRGGDNGGDNNGGGRRRGGMFGTPSPESQALQTAVDNNAPAAQVKDLLAKYEAARKAKQDALKQAQENLREVLTVPQEAQATLLGLLD